MHRGRTHLASESNARPLNYFAQPMFDTFRHVKYVKFLPYFDEIIIIDLVSSQRSLHIFVIYGISDICSYDTCTFIIYMFVHHYHKILSFFSLNLSLSLSSLSLSPLSFSLSLFLSLSLSQHTFIYFYMRCSSITDIFPHSCSLEMVLQHEWKPFSQ